MRNKLTSNLDNMIKKMEARMDRSIHDQINNVLPGEVDGAAMRAGNRHFGAWQKTNMTNYQKYATFGSSNGGNTVGP